MELPSSCDALVIGAGPAGSAAAVMLARAGARVVLVDQGVFPRDKVCGDGLISDALGALDTLGVRDAVLRDAVPVPELCVQPPYGRPVVLPGEFACLPRGRLDALLADAARQAGASVTFGVTAAGALIDNGRVAGARLRSAGGSVEVRAGVTVLATGASAAALKTFGLDADMQPGGVAGRAYFQAPPEMAARFRSLVIGYDRSWCPGYGWIFPSPGGRFNIGVGLFTEHSTERRLKEFWRVFTSRFAQAAEIIRASSVVTPFRGAPLRTAMRGGSFGRDGLVAIGEAASLTYAATGEGIGKAMESGIIAARHVMEALSGRAPVADVHRAYEGEFRDRFSLRYRAYSVAQAWAAHPLILSLLAARTNAGTFARAELQDLVAERGDCKTLFSKRGLLKALLK